MSKSMAKTQFDKKMSTFEIALITGASSGIGLEIAKILARRGCHLILVARRRDRLEALCAELEKEFGVRVHVIDCDLSRDKASEFLFSKVRELGLRVDILVNNAGFGMVGEFDGMDPARLENMMQLNMIALTLLTRLFGHEMKERKNGRILQIASVGAFQPCPYFSVYAATKAYVLSFGEAIAHEFKPHGVSVTTVYPGFTRTEFMDVAGMKLEGRINKQGMTAACVADLAVRAMFKGEATCITGWSNQLMAILTKITPRFLVTIVAGKISKRLS